MLFSYIWYATTSVRKYMHAKGRKQVRKSAAVSDCTKISCVRKVGEPRIRKLSTYEIFWIYSTLLNGLVIRRLHGSLNIIWRTKRVRDDLEPLKVYKGCAYSLGCVVNDWTAHFLSLFFFFFFESGLVLEGVVSQSPSSRVTVSHLQLSYRTCLCLLLVLRYSPVHTLSYLHFPVLLLL